MKRQPAASTFRNVKDVEAYAKTRMEKVLADLQHACPASAPAGPR